MKYVATVSGVREVVLEGRADLVYWSAHLQPFGLRPRALDETYEEAHEGPIYLPAGRGLRYFAKISGTRTLHPFDATCDVLEIDAAADAQGLGHVAASAFEPTRWRIGTASTHPRSKTLSVT